METDIIIALITAGFSFVTAVGALIHSIISSRRHHKLAEFVEKSSRRLEALRIAKMETEEVHENLRDLIVKTQELKQCIDILLVDDHPSKSEAAEQAERAAADLTSIYSTSLGRLPEEVRKWCHGLKSRAEEVAQLAGATWRLQPTVPITKELKSELFHNRIILDAYQRNIETGIRSLDAEVADRLYKFMVSAD